jgi:hypothetical protein
LNHGFRWLSGGRHGQGSRVPPRDDIGTSTDESSPFLKQRTKELLLVEVWGRQSAHANSQEFLPLFSN